MKPRHALFLLPLLALFITPAARAQLPGTFAYQGYLLGGDGQGVSGTVNLDFRLYASATGGEALWSETQPDVAVSEGLFSVALGSVQPLDGVVFGEAMWLGVRINGGSELVPRTALGASPSALSLRGLRVFPDQGLYGTPSLIGGHRDNRIEGFVEGAMIGGGGGAGELRNKILDGAFFATIGGGAANSSSESFTTIGGGEENSTSADYATIGGGQKNEATDTYATIGGGNTNEAGSGGTVGGGGGNRAGEFGVVAGGSSNAATAPFAAVGGGISNGAVASTATVGGGGQNRADGVGATVPGGVNNQASGDYSFAAGFNAQAAHDGAFVWADYFDAASPPFSSTARGQFLIRAAGGVGIGTNTPRGALHTNNPIVNAPDLVVGGASNDPNGIITSDLTLPNSSLFLFSNGDAGFKLDSDDDTDEARFLIVDSDEDPLFIVQEDGRTRVDNLEAGGRVTADAFEAEQALGSTGTPEVGGVYRDNVVYAWANVQSNGSVSSSYGCTVSKQALGGYRVTFNRPLPNGVSAIVTVQTANDPVIATATASQSQANVSTKVFSGGGFVAADYGFFIQVVGRP